MEKRLKNYLSYMKEQTANDPASEDKSRLREDLLIQIGFFQHERLIHLLVTITFALLAFAAMFFSLINDNLGIYLLLALLLLLLIPYIRHYYILENGIQKLYQYYDKLR